MNDLKIKDIDKVVVKESLDSTNEFAKRLLSDDRIDSNMLIVAETQTRGRGRFTHSWLSPEGGLYFTLVEDEKFIQGGLPLVIGLAICEVLDTTFDINTRLKWPNDILLEGKKLGGILIQNCDKKTIIGCGINTFENRHIQQNMQDKIITISLGQVTRNSLLKNVVENIYMRMNELIDTSFKELKSLCLARSVMLNDEITISIPGSSREYRGIFTGLGDEGELILASEDGERVVRSGHIISGAL